MDHPEPVRTVCDLLRTRSTHPTAPAKGAKGIRKRFLGERSKPNRHAIYRYEEPETKLHSVRIRHALRHLVVQI